MMQIKYRYRIKRLLSFLLALVMVINIGGIASAEQDSTTENFAFKAAIYSSSDYTDTPVILGDSTDTGANTDSVEIQDWDHDTDRYLKIDLTGLTQEADASYQIVIKTQPIIYTTYIPMVSGATASFEGNEAITVNTSEKYPLLEHSGTITYKLDAGTNTTTFRLALRYDNAMWNKAANAALGDGTNPLIAVSLEKVVENTTTTLYETELTNAYAGEQISTQGNLGIYRETRPDASNSTGIISCGYGEKVLIKTSQMGSGSDYGDGHYYDELSLEVELPRYTENGVTHYMELEELSYDISSGTVQYERIPTTSHENGKVTIVAKNIYFKNNDILKFYLKYPESVKDMDNILFSGGSVKITGDGTVILPAKKLSITMKTVKDPVVFATISSGSVNTRNLDVVQRLGTYGLGNSGGASGEFVVHMEFDANNTNQMHATSMQLMPDCVQEYITVTYTLIDRDGNMYKDGESFTYQVKNPFYMTDPSEYGMKALFYRGMLPSDQQDYFFKTVSYSIKSIPEGIKLYHSGAINASYSGGSFWGYVDTATPSEKLVTKISVEDIGLLQSPSPNLNRTVEVILDSTMDVPYGMDTPYVSTTNVVNAGESITVGGRVVVVGYPYTSNSILSKIQLGVLLPAGISINEDTVTLGGKAVEVEVSRQKEAVNGKYLWIVQFPETTKIGYYSEKLEGLATGSTLTYRMTLNTDITVSSHELNLDETIFAAGSQANNSSGGSYLYYSADEPQGYDLNGTGKLDKVAKFSGNKTITIQAAPAQLEITDGVRKEDTSLSANSQLDHYADYVIYELDVACENGGSAEDFFYFIPVPKASEESTDFTKASEVGLELHGPVDIQTTGTPLQVLYTTETGLTYQTAKTTNSWVTADKITDWADVTLMKVILADGHTAMLNGSSNVISASLYFVQYDSIDETVIEYDYASYAGAQIQWVSKGYYHYTNGANIFAGDIATYGANVQLQYTAWETKEVELTAAKGKKPTDSDAKNTVTIEVEIPFKNEQKYSLALVNPKDVTLVNTKDPISNENSNTNFGISVSVNDGDASDILTENVEQIVGTAEAGEKTTLTFSLHNGDALSDIVKERYVEIKLVGNNGVIIPVKIIINREMSLAGDAASAIQGGKEYLQISGNEQKATISADSAFTAQYVVEGLIPDNYEKRELQLSNPAEGTTIVMIDWTNTNAPKYYHYILEAGEKNIVLTEFTQMGSTSTYVYPTGTTPVDERLLFIVDLPDDGKAEGGTISLVTNPKTGNEIISTKLTYEVDAMRTFSFACENEDGMSSVTTTGNLPVKIGKLMTFNFTTVFEGTSESRYVGRQAAIVVAAEGVSNSGSNGGTTTTVVPSDSKLVVGDNSYYLNSKGCFIVPLGELKSGSSTMKYVSSKSVPVKLTASLWVSANADALHPMLGQKVSEDIVISMTPQTLPSVKITGMSDRLLTKEDLKTDISLTYQTANASEYTTTLEVHVKDGNGYRPIYTVLNTVNGTVSDNGHFSIGTGGTLKLKFSELTPAGTYRLIIKVSDGAGTVSEVPYNFIVIEE